MADDLNLDWKHLPLGCPVMTNDGANCPHRKTENLVLACFVLQFINFIALLVVVAMHMLNHP